MSTCALDPAPHPFERDNAEAIAANWRREIVAKPALFDGTVVLLSELAYRDRRLEGRCHAVRYSTFMHWRSERTTPSAGHAFAHAMLVSATARWWRSAWARIRSMPAGSISPAGSFEPQDFPGGKVDLHSNMAREVMEETGLDIDAARRGRAVPRPVDGRRNSDLSPLSS